MYIHIIYELIVNIFKLGKDDSSLNKMSCPNYKTE